MIRLKKLFTKCGIEYRPIVSGNLLRQPFLKDYTLKDSTNVDLLHNNGVYIGNSHFVGNLNPIRLIAKIKRRWSRPNKG